MKQCGYAKGQACLCFKSKEAKDQYKADQPAAKDKTEPANLVLIYFGLSVGIFAIAMVIAAPKNKCTKTESWNSKNAWKFAIVSTLGYTVLMFG